MPSQSREKVTWSDEPGDEPPTVPFTKRREIFLKKEIVMPLSTFEEVVGDDFFVDVVRQTQSRDSHLIQVHTCKNGMMQQCKS